jgi:hypothetical protein
VLQATHTPACKKVPGAHAVQAPMPPVQAVQFASQVVHMASVVAPHAVDWNVPV